MLDRLTVRDLPEGLVDVVDLLVLIVLRSLLNFVVEVVCMFQVKIIWLDLLEIILLEKVLMVIIERFLESLALVRYRLEILLN